ncbi:MAG: hypothetical protein U1G08_18045 [Verrucomicrobiota bacterium]
MNRTTSGRPLRATLTLQMDNHSAGVMLQKMRDAFPNPSPGLSRVFECLEESKTKDPDHLCTITINGAQAMSILATGMAVLN